jgi:hypothetical protein
LKQHAARYNNKDFYFTFSLRRPFVTAGADINPLMSGGCMSHHFAKKIPRSTHRDHLSLFYSPQKDTHLLHHTALTYWFLYRSWSVFTARYVLDI